jgi:hypothetical protein
MNAEEIVEILIPVQAAWRYPDSIVRETSSWFQVVTPSSKITPHNGVYRSIVSPEEADEAIDHAINDFSKYQTPFRWVITGATRPVDFRQRLEKFKFKQDGEALGLAAETAEIAKLAVDAIEITDLTEEFLEDWIDAAIVGWDNPESFRPGLRTGVLRALREQREELRYFSALIEGQIVGTGTLRLCKQSGHLLGSSVRPQFRGRGVYRALIARRAQVSADYGLALMTTHGKVDTSAPILKKVGFRHYNDMVQYAFS